MIYKSLKHAGFVAVILLAISCNGQTNSGNKQIPQSYLNIIKQQCANPDIIEVERKEEGIYEVDFICDGKVFEIVMKENTLLYTSFGVSQEEVPFEIINKKLLKSYPGFVLDEISKIITPDTSFLKVEIIKEGIEQNVYFSLDGKWLKLKPVDVSQKWDFQNITQNKMYVDAQYNFLNPDSVYEMPELLREISGLAIADSANIYCVQDELGSIFQYNIQRQEIVNSFRFTDVGDFEDITIFENVLIVLRSDGHIFKYDLDNHSNITSLPLPVKTLNVEGICYNNGYLYLANKDAVINQSNDKRIVYRADINNLSKLESYLEIDIPELSNFLTSHYPEIGNTTIQFNPSAIAIHPKTNEIYILSAEDRIIAIYNKQKLKNVIPLSSDIYYKPEGLSFYENGDLLISSEGDKNGFVKGSINVLKYKKSEP
ncbi:MAG: hypothetical protein WAU21_05335 [Chitinophagales bacterium]|nr:hypothetical protein [Chitinophagales bacterium]MBP9705173.1 hypothetical protein [Chitinophagales bacterium]